jgi:hypothetical protein
MWLRRNQAGDVDQFAGKSKLSFMRPAKTVGEKKAIFKTRQRH